MGFLPIALGVLLYAAAIAAKDDPNYQPSLNFRPTNVTLNDLYTWVGSYYNATAQVDFIPYGGMAASAKSQCPAAFSNQTSSTNYAARLGLTEPSTYNSANDPVNAILTLWPLGFNFTGLVSEQAITSMPGLDFALFSSNPYYDGNNLIGAGSNNFNWTLENTTSPPYNMSSTITGAYSGWGHWTVDTVTSCASSSNWLFGLISGNIDFNGNNLTFPNPTIDLQFDGTTANLSLQGYVEANPIVGTPPDTTEGVPSIPGEVRLTFSGVIDSYHSDILRNDTSTPTWLRTVGFNNNSANIGYTTSGSKSSQPIGSLSWTAIVSALWLAIL